jgi:hypothetical protein
VISSHDTEAVAAELQAVGSDTGSDVSQIKRLLAVERRARVAVGDGHVRERQAVEDGAVLERDVVDDETFAVVEADAEAPVLPCDVRAVDLERRSLGSGKLLSLAAKYGSRLLTAQRGEA